MKTAYLIYYANQDSYEGQDFPFGIAESEEHAKTICAEIINFGQKLAAKMKYPFEEGISDEEYSIREEVNKTALKMDWPHGWIPHSYSDFEAEWSYEEGEAQRMSFDARTVAYKALPLL